MRTASTLTKNLGLALFMLACLVLPARAQEPVTHFEHLTIDDGLSDNIVYSIAQDHTGFLWFGTQNGLNKFDGYNFTVYRHDPFNPNTVANDNAGNIYLDRDGILWIGTWGGGLDRLDPATGQFTNYRHDPDNANSLSHDRVQTIFQDRDGWLWIGTSGGGLNKFNPYTETFVHYLPDPADPNSLSNDRIWRIVQDDQNFLWIATSDGLNRLDPETETFTRYFSEPGDPRSLSHSLIRTLYIDRAGTLWVGTENGLNKFTPATNDFDVYLNNPRDPHSLNDNIINAIYEDSRNRLWVGTRSGGLNLLERQTGQFTRYVNNPLDPNSLSYDDIRWIHEDHAGVLWLGTRGGGVDKLVPNSGRFIHFASVPNKTNSLNNNEVRAVYEDAAGMLWIGTKGGGLNKYDPHTGQFMAYSYSDGTLSSNDVYAIYRDSTGVLWLGTSGGGLIAFDPVQEIFATYRHVSDNPASLSNDDVNIIFEDRQGRLWVGTKGGGLNRFNRDTRTFTHYRQNSANARSLSNDDVYAIHQDQTGRFWVGTYGGGLNRFEPDSGEFTPYRYSPDDPNSLSDNNIYTIYENSDGVLWIGTANGGLNKFNPETNEFSRFTQKDGLASDVIYSILEDEQGYLWLSTNKGLSKFDSVTGDVVNYDANDGLERIIYREGAATKGADGALYFGGINGLTKFYPAEISDNHHIPPVVLTNLSILNEPFDFGKPLTALEQLPLSYRDDVLSFDFAALDYTNPAKNRYAYQLVGFDEDWIEAGTRHFATYTNLDPGEYTLRVKGSNNAGVWNEAGLAVNLSITPPFWETWWFRTLSVLVLVGLVFSAYSLRIRSVEAQREQLRATVAERTAALRQANQHLQTVTDHLRDELALAQKIQEGLLPPPRPNWADLDVICYSRPAYKVGGDFYDYHAFNGTSASATDHGPETERFVLIVGDVSGKGMPAALLMAVSLGSIQSLMTQPAVQKEQLMGRLNQALKPYTQTTNQNCALCCVEIQGSRLSAINAGGITPLVRCAGGGTRWLDASGLPLGVPIDGEAHYRQDHHTLAANDMVIIVSDGVIEVKNAGGEMFGFERLEQAVAGGPSGSAGEMLAHVKTEINRYIGAIEPHDDLTIVVIRV